MSNRKDKRQLDDQELADVARHFKLLGEPMRLKILQTLCREPRTVGDIVSATGATQANVSKHLALLAAADIFVLASRFEGLPMSVIEAMCSALPVIACDIRGPREQVADGQTGFLVPPGDAGALAVAIRRLADDAPLRAAMGTAGRARAREQYREANVLARTLDALGL